MNRNRTLNRWVKTLVAVALAATAAFSAGTAEAAPINDCTGCHGMPPLDDLFRNITTGALSGNHQTHSTPNNCGYCHKSQAGNAHRNGRIEFVNNIHNSRLTARYKNITAVNQDPNPATDTCTNVNCHFESRSPQRGVLPLSTAPANLQTSCRTCHGNAPTTGLHPYGIQKHALYYGTDSTSCSYCHSDHSLEAKPFAHATSAGNRALDIRFTKFPNTGGSYTGDVTYPLYLYNASRNGVCNNLYCHSRGDKDASPYNAPEQPAKWDVAFGESCLGCHEGDVASGSPMASGSHLAHNGLGQLSNIDCVRCHNATVSNSRAVSDRSKHVNKLVNISFDALVGGTAAKYGTTASPLTKTPGTSYRKCSNNYCHSDGTTTVAPFNNYSVTWGGTMLGNCMGCHGSNATTTKIIATGNHRKHIDATFNPAIGTPNGCVECHARTVSNNTTIINKNMHIDGFKSYSGLRSGRLVAGSCNTVYCHSSGQAIPAYRTIVPWANTVTNYTCKSCHGASAGGDTPAPPAGVFASLYGEPNYNNYSSANRNWFNTHNSKHIKSAASCEVCHINTTADGLTVKSGTTLHANQQRNVAFDTVKAGNNSPYYDNAAKTCNNVYCHSNGRRTGTVYRNPRWGGPVLTNSCDYCHPIASLSGVHSIHVNGLIPTFYNFTANKSVGGTYKFGCSNCHPMDEATYHTDGIIEVSLRKTNPGAGGAVSTLRAKNAATADFINIPGSGVTGTSGISVTCSAAYCHSNGFLSGATYIYATSRDWYANPGDFTGDKCASCHGNAPNSTIIGSPAHYDAANWLGSGKPGGHIVGIHYNNIYSATNANGLAAAGTGNTNSHGNATYSTTINCSMCHNDTVTVAYNDKSVNCSTAGCHDTAPRLKGTMSVASAVTHVNGTPDVKFKSVFVVSKAQTRNQAIGWTRTNGYKAAGSYDTATSDLQASGVYTQGTKNCANISCHFGWAVKWTDTGGATTCYSCHGSL